MKKTKNTYGVYNIIEWHAIIKAGKATIKVPFSGGAMTTQGVTPATFTTTNPVVQLAIERSAAFASGKIKLIKTYPTNEEVEVERNPEVIKEAHKAKEAILEANKEADLEAGAAEAAEPSQNEADASSQPQNEPGAVVNVSCERDAAEYLRDHYGIALSKLRYKSNIAAAAEQYGVTFEYISEEKAGSESL